MSLCLILTGQCRSFFNDVVQRSFIRLIENSKNHYNLIYIVCIINEWNNEEIEQLHIFLQSLPVKYIVEEYEKHSVHLKKINEDKLMNKGYQNMAHVYNSNSGEIQTIMSPTHHKNYPSIEPFIVDRQWHQLQIGIYYLLEYEKQHNIAFNYCTKMRFDNAIIDPEFYPHSPTGDILSKLTFNESIKASLIRKMKELNIDTLEEYLQYVKNNPILFPNYISSYPETSFGCYFFNNYISLENIINGTENILYCFVDHLIFGERDVFIKLQTFVDEFGTIESSLNQKGIQAFFGSESQLLLFCFKNNINPLMYVHNSTFYVQTVTKISIDK